MAACVLQKGTGGTLPGVAQRGGGLALGCCGRKKSSSVPRTFGPREMLDYYTGYFCVAVSGKVLFKVKSQVKSLLSTLEWGQTQQGRTQPLWVMTRGLDTSQFSKGFLPTVVLSPPPCPWSQACSELSMCQKMKKAFQII